jgi:hypothetical protein
MGLDCRPSATVVAPGVGLAHDVRPTTTAGQLHRRSP